MAPLISSRVVQYTPFSIPFQLKSVRSSILYSLTMAPIDRSAAGKAKKQANFTNFEIEQLAHSWLAWSGCSAVGANQNRQEYWNKIVTHFSKAMVELQKKFPATVRLVPRSLRSLGSKWGDINHDCAKFCGALSTIQSLNESGTTIEEQMKSARDLYQQTNKEGKEFGFEGAWYILKDSPKWQTFAKLNEKMTERAAKRKQKQNAANQETLIHGDEGYDSPVEDRATPEMVTERPLGNKKAKELAAIEKRLGKNKGSLADSHALIAAALEHRASAMDTVAEIALFAVDLDILDKDAKEFMLEKRSVAKAALALKRKSLTSHSENQENQVPTRSSTRRPCSLNSLNRLHPSLHHNTEDISEIGSDGHFISRQFVDERCLADEREEEEWDNRDSGGDHEAREVIDSQRDGQESTLREYDLNSFTSFL